MRIPVVRGFDLRDPIGYLHLQDGIEIAPDERLALSYRVLEQDSTGNPTKIAVQCVSLMRDPVQAREGETNAAEQ